MKVKLLSGMMVCCTLLSFGQMKTSYQAEVFGSAATGEHTPFWMVNHNWGVTALEAGNFYVRGGVFHEQRLTDDWSFDAGIDLIGGNASSYGNAWIQQLYGRINWKLLRLDIGSREDYTSLLNPSLSSGDFIHSNNARPLPQIKGSLSDFLLVPYTKGNFFIKGDFSAGSYLDGKWQENRALPRNQSYTKGVFSHDKALYFRWGDINAGRKMQFTFGMMHATQWGGTLFHYVWDYKKETANYLTQPQPKSLDAFMRVVIAKEAAATVSDTTVSESDKIYVSGSQWGGYTFKHDYRLGEHNQLSLYLQHFFEDGSGMVFENYSDNLIGLEFSSKNKQAVSGAVLEYIYTRQQTGPIHFPEYQEHPVYRQLHKGNGNDNYYNNVDYISGPSHYGKSLGTPLFLSPEYNTDGSVNFHGSRIWAWHLGVEGYLSSTLQYRLLLTTGKNWGRYYFPYTEVHKGFASQLELIYTCPKSDGLSFQLVTGYDNGEFFGGNTFGGSLAVRLGF
ncbi:MAG: hypothetical protein EZS26_001350 [Candidatus Ordinivivax streblomastigis]|uniref:Capsule assembly protein Wzi n=1 Tax=Candidatus Ordinivivax streblomastigis TaxID=2540710 RepID=A0A5M8P2B4_9BACT|nr:MAG: hypothetical protein EZS26_001350 [Candidatus Ordinivivax streblomastigis]